MPIYEYQCKNCKERTEILQKISDLPAVDCPNCHEPALKRLISPAGFQLKGTGWYVTDFRDKGKSKTAKDPATTTQNKNNEKQTNKEIKKDEAH